MADAPKAKPKIVYVIRENDDKKYWHRCGIAWVNRDGSLKLELDLFPNVAFNIRDQAEEK
jgi:hypothetical protein